MSTGAQSGALDCDKAVLETASGTSEESVAVAGGAGGAEVFTQREVSTREVMAREVLTHEAWMARAETHRARCVCVARWT